MRVIITPEGSRYPRDQAINGGSEGRSVSVHFSVPPRPMGAVEIRNLVRFTPAVDNLVFDLSGETLSVSGNFAWDTVYKMALVPTPVTDQAGRRLDMSGTSELFFYFPRKPAFLQWGRSHGVVERFGPRRVALEGRGMERVDLRIYPVAPLDRSLWPFPGVPVGLPDLPEEARPGTIRRNVLVSDQAGMVPLAAGMEPLNSNLTTAPPEAKPAGKLTQAPTYAAYMDDQVTFNYESLPKGTYDFYFRYFRTRATTPGRFIQPPALAEMMYDGAYAGARRGPRGDRTEGVTGSHSGQLVILPPYRYNPV